MSFRRPGRGLSRVVVVAVYVAAVVVAIQVLRHPALAGLDDLSRLLVADVLATVFVFVCSCVWANASLYDPYWSVAPPLLALWIFRDPPDEASGPRLALVSFLVALWAVRLTWNWARGWGGLEHEDWRYRDLRARCGRWFPLVNLFGIQLLPTLLVFAGCLPLFAVARATRPLGPLDGLAACLTLAAIALEATADRQLADFRRSAPGPDDVLDRGVWAWSRHPNYLGEILFWWGLWTFVPASGGGPAWTALGAIAITVLFLVVSLPLVERRMARRRGFADYCRRTPILVPWPRR